MRITEDLALQDDEKHFLRNFIFVGCVSERREEK